MHLKLFRLIALFTFPVFLMSPSCEKEESTETETVDTTDKEEEQKQEITDLIYNFDGGYEDLWEVVDSLQTIGLYESALTTVEVIFDSARIESNAPQVVKSVMYKMKYNSYLAEDDYVVAIDGLNELSSEESFPLKQIIHSVTAQVYWGYYQNNRWKFINRTQTVNFDNKDIRTWDLNTIADHVNKHYIHSLSNKDSLQHAALNDFKEILVSYEDDDKQRPTLYDFLAHRAINYFQNTESALIRPADKFRVQGKSYFGDSKEFLATSTESNDSLSNLLYATRIFKDLTVFHQNDKDPSALIDLTLRRLKFARSHSVNDQKDELYLSALERMSERYKSNEAYSEIRFYVAEYFNNQTVDKTKTDDPHKWDRKKALLICDEAISKYPESFGASQCKGLRSRIMSKSLSFNTEVAYEPKGIGKMLLNYKNIDTLYFRIVKVNWDYFYKQSNYGEDLMKDLLGKKVIQEWTKTMKNPGDYNDHSTEILLSERELGQYVILASDNKDFKLKENAIAYGSFWVSNLSFNYRRTEDETIEVFVTDRNSGKPLPNVQASIYTQKYNYLLRKYDVVKQESYKTDSDGMFTVRSTKDYRYLYVDLSYGSDHFNNSNQLYQYRPYSSSKSYSTTTFFTDRAIYRPGQTIHFKGIRIHHNDNDHRLETGKQSTVVLFDANYQKVSELKLTTNEYGTFSGSFTAPTGLLNGQMHIQDDHGSKYFFVEEYKRPKFEVEFKPMEGVYKIGQQIKLTGTAKAFAGSNIDAADVTYRVTRSCNFPYWTWYRWGYYPYSQSTEISNGELKTDEKGEFIIEFKAEEDGSIDKKFFPYYTYTVSADVTDLNGETHSASQWVVVGYNAMELSVGVGGTIERNDKNRFKVSTVNLNGQKVEANGKINVTRLIEPDQHYITSNWSKPDIQEISEEKYHKLFPHDVYDNEDDYTKYKKGETVLSIDFNTAKNDSVDFKGMKNWKPGRYVLEAISIDAFGAEVKDIKYITVLDKSAKENPTNDIWLMTPLKAYCEPGEKAEFLISSAAENLYVNYEIEYRGDIVKRERILLSKGQKLVTIPVEEKHRGNFTVHFSSVKYGRSFISRQQVIVPYSNKELDIKFETFRNKLLPGQEEEWKLKIKGPKGEKVAAEMVAAMYDASLDEFASNNFFLSVFNSYYSSRYWSSDCFGQKYSQLYYENWNPYEVIPMRNYDELNWFGYYTYYGYYGYRYKGDYYDYDGNYALEGALMDRSVAMDMPMEESEAEFGWAENDKLAGKKEAEKAANVVTATGISGETRANEQQIVRGGAFDDETGKNKDSRNGLGNIKARSNLNETAFFYPQLETNEKGEVIIKFTIPESLTKWKFMGMAHTKDLKIGYIEEEVVTQKELMVMPNAPRFLREGDHIRFSAKVSNLTEEDLNGSAQLMLFDAITMKPVDALFNNTKAILDFSAKKGQSAALSWELDVPDEVGAVLYRIVAKAKNHTDGEEMALPILSNRMLVTESLPLPIRGVGTKDFYFTKLLNSGSSSSIKHHRLTLEFTSNPAWYAVQAMPYMMEYPYECSEQVFTRFYSNSIATHLMNSNPKIKNVFDQWKQSSPDAFLSNLEKNQELKSLILEETPWVLDAKDENERKKRVALLFDLNKMSRELGRALRKLEKMQVANGGWTWFPGMPESRYITQHIITGMGHLDHLGIKDIRDNNRVWNMVSQGVRYLDARIIEDYQWLKKHDPNYLTEQRIGQIQVQYLYARSYFKDIPISKRLKEAFDYYQDQAKTYWKNFNLYNEGMIALQAKRYEVKELPEMIIASLKERAITHEELGMYWKDNVSGYYWYQAPIETQALLIEAFDEVTGDMRSVEDMKVWLLKQKQTTDWKTTKATAEACYALLLRGTDLLANEEQVEIRINGDLLDPKALGAEVEAGTGYFKTSWMGKAVKPEMGNVSITRKTEGVSWGAMYWQYFEDLDKITSHETPLKLNKKLFLVQNTASGPVMTPVNDNTSLKPGDKVRIRIELRTDRDMEYVHMKDMRASGFEPVNVFSRYRYQDGLGYYESTRDAATNFFFDYLPKGTYVFEYDVRVSHYGDFSNGVATIQCMYAPEFTSHSEGIRVKIKE